ncbi:retrotransposon hot spot (RHS) protein, putative [Trypanosoma cruzi]|nr:retrotransposon hot spot (RHS) protein, putative [Trypanosoma cruzi]
MGAGSYLLYQLLHCDAEKLSVVVYVIGRQAFLFDKTTHTMIRYMELSAMEHFLAFVSSRGVKGYIIYDVAKGGRNPSVFFVPSEWGMLVVTSPNVNNFEDWRKHKGAVPIVINCPEEMDVKAMCFWMKQIQPTGEQAEEQLEEQAREQAEYWETVEERMNEVGPIPRSIFDVLEYRIHLTAIDTTVKNINATNATDYMGVGSDEIWIAKGVSHKIVKVVRVRNENRVEVGYNAPVSHSARVKITQRLTNMTPPVDVFNLLLRGYSYLAWVALEQSGTATFMNPHAVDIIQRKLTELHPEGRLTSRSSVLSNNPRGHPTRSETLKKLSGNPARMNLEYRVLYEPVVGNFPLVDALFFMESPRKTLVGLQMTTTAGGHHTQTSTVRLFKERMASYFNGWEEFSRELSWEIIYVQHADSTPMNGWRRCDVVNSDNLSDDESREIAAFWEEEMRQYQVSISSRDI